MWYATMSKGKEWVYSTIYLSHSFPQKHDFNAGGVLIPDGFGVDMI